MNVLVYLLPLALLLGGLGLAAFVWSLRTKQFEDLKGAGWRAIADDDLPTQNNLPTQDNLPTQLKRGAS